MQFIRRSPVFRAASFFMPEAPKKAPRHGGFAPPSPDNRSAFFREIPCQARNDGGDGGSTTIQQMPAWARSVSLHPVGAASRHRVVSMPAPRITTQDAAHGKIQPLAQPMFMQCLHGIYRAGRRKPARRRQQGRNT
jgi:hypothetical protein